MGNGGSSLVDCVQDGDTQQLKQELASRVADVEDGELSDDELHSELEDAVHTALSMEITTPQQYQQLQIALELLLHVAPTALQTSECNEAQWTALHRACVTSNLAFVAFLFHRYAAYVALERDAFGLLPLDLVPPELGFIGATTDTSVADTKSRPRLDDLKALPSTERERIELALALLRQRKAELQSRTVRTYLSSSRGSNNQDSASATADATAPYFIAFEPSRGQLGHEVAGVVHQLNRPLRVRYHLPRTEAFLFGYFQLIWRADDEPRSEEPHYERHVLLRESAADLDHIAPCSEVLLASNQPDARRRLHDTDTSNDELTGSVAIDVAHLDDDVVCHVLFVASDRQLMKREIVLSTEGVRLVRADALNVDPTARTAEHDPYAYEEPPFEYDADSDSELDGFVFHVAGEAFKHPSEALAGRSFDSVEAFETFVKEVRATKERTSPTRSVSLVDEAEVKTSDKHQDVRRPSVPSNQDEQQDEKEEDEEEDDDDDELVLVEVTKEIKRQRPSPEQNATHDNQDEVGARHL